jgi:hypothetical protein
VSVIYAEDTVREAVQNALKRRHTYASTDNIILDFRMGDHFMGDEFEAKTVPAVWAKLIRTAPLSVVRNIKAIIRCQLM